MINGFIPSSKVVSICKWFSGNKLSDFEGFAKMYNQLSEEVIDELNSIGADDISHLYANYVFPLTNFYFAALDEKQSIVIWGE